MLERDPRFAEIRDLADLPRRLLREAKHFPGTYKGLGRRETAILAWHSVTRAHALVDDAVQRFAEAGTGGPRADTRLFAACSCSPPAEHQPPRRLQ